VTNGLKTENFLTEDELLNWLQIRKVTLNGLRTRRQFPFVKVSQDCRVYYLPDVFEWFLANRMVLNRAGLIED